MEPALGKIEGSGPELRSNSGSDHCLAMGDLGYVGAQRSHRPQPGQPVSFLPGPEAPRVLAFGNKEGAPGGFGGLTQVVATLQSTGEILTSLRSWDCE